MFYIVYILCGDMFTSDKENFHFDIVLESYEGTLFVETVSTFNKQKKWTWSWKATLLFVREARFIVSGWCSRFYHNVNVVLKASMGLSESDKRWL